MKTLVAVLMFSAMCFGQDGYKLKGAPAGTPEPQLKASGTNLNGQCLDLNPGPTVAACASVVKPKEPPVHKYVLVYMTDLGCIGNEMYPEGGCPHVTATMPREFQSAAEALRFVNDSCKVESDSGIGVSTSGFVISSSSLGEVDCSQQDKIHLFDAVEVPLKQVVTGHHTETRQVPKDVQVEDKKWVVDTK